MAGERRVCDDCKTLIIDLLTGADRTVARWRWHQTSFVSLNHATFHLDGTVQQLQKSSDSCLLCQLLIQQVENLRLTGEQSGQYFLFATGRWRPSYKIHIGIGTIDHYAQQDSMTRCSRVLALLQSPRLARTVRPVWHSTATVQPGLQQLPFLNLGSHESLSKIKTWLAACVDVHSCRSLQQQQQQHLRRLQKQQHDYTPVRVLDLSHYEKGRLVLTTIDTNVNKYATLSYLWGESVRLKTKVRCHNNADYLARVDFSNLYVTRSLPSALRPHPSLEPEIYEVENIPTKAFPRTLHHGLEVASRLGFRYIWIDSLCIVQNDDADEDWNRQSAMMSLIYSNSTLNISASTCPNSTTGFLNDVNSRGTDLCTVRHDNGDIQICVRDDSCMASTSDFLSSTRGWIFQERLVSPATIHFTDEGLLWECSHSQQHSHYYESIACEPWKSDWRATLSQTGESHEAVYDAWNRWIYLFSGCNLFDNKDKLPAVAGVAKAVAKHLQLDHSYFAGLWKADFARALLWRRHGRLVRSLTKLNGVAPSWSWASVNGKLEGVSGKLHSRIEKEDMRIIELRAPEEVEGTYGRLNWASADPASSTILTATGLLQHITIDRHKKAGERPQAWRECGVSTGFVNTENVECLLDEWSDLDERYLDCWCFRVGSEAMKGGRFTDHFLLLRKLPHSDTEYTRIGTARCDENFNKGRPIKHSGVLESETSAQITIL